MRKTFAVIACASLFEQTTFGSAACSGKILDVMPQDTGVMFVTLDVSRSQIPACGIGQPNRFTVNTTDMAGQAMAATILTAFSLRKPIAVAGNNACDTWGDTEGISYLSLKP